MPGKGTPPGEALYPECGRPGLGGVWRHRRSGTRTCAGCREQIALRAADYRRQRYLVGTRRVPALGTQRRLRALARIGWSHTAIGDRLGWSRTAVGKLLSQGTVNRETALAVAGFYREHAWETGPSAHAARIAAKAGWPGPMDWDDPDDPGEVPACELERAHREALGMERARIKRERRAASRLTERMAA